nr:immunoglobulin light chain junction region [Macaca mulatta]MOW72867.1 immunoglobulin light chain junction region [Macaca mulatta]MOW72935.1 immunoglobulin light chain junction region [Macaca mulatta]MOW72953.1 immunoglobulin light chain junction region [Macaca mulatta]MOW72981.1 immunoglobulin light chain junction region [Macaca mulatta]
CQQHESSPWTF